MGRRGRFVEQQGTVRQALGAASNVQALYDELDEWRSNLEGNGMEQLPKHEEVEEACAELEGAELESRASDLERELERRDADCPVRQALDSIVQWKEWRGYGKRALRLSRSQRCSNACLALGAVLEQLKKAAEQLAGDDEVHCLLDDLDEGIAQAMDVSFPGMY